MWEIIAWAVLIFLLFKIFGAIIDILEKIMNSFKEDRIYLNNSVEKILNKPEDYNIVIIKDSNKMMIKSFFTSSSKDNLISLFLVINHFEKEGWKIKEETKESAKLQMHYVVLEKVS